MQSCTAPPFKRNAGFTLVEVAIAAVVAGVLATAGLYYQAQEMRYQMARAQVDQLKVLGTAMEKYHGQYAKDLLNGLDVPLVANDWAPTVAELKALKLLDGNFSATNLYSPAQAPAGGYAIKIRPSPLGCTGTTCSLFGMAYLNNAVFDARGRPDSSAVGEALAYGGGDIGVSTSVDKDNVRGYGSLWVEPSPLPATAGILAIRNSGQGANFVPLDGSVPMTGALKMGSNDISDVRNFVATGTVSGADMRATNSVTANSVLANSVTATTVAATGTVSGSNVSATGTVSAVNVNASNAMGTNSLGANSVTAGTATVTGALNMRNSQTIFNNGRQHINANENLYLQPWSSGATVVGGGGGSGQLNVYGNQYMTGNGDVNDIYVRAAGKWASQLGGGALRFGGIYEVMWQGNPGGRGHPGWCWAGNPATGGCSCPSGYGATLVGLTFHYQEWDGAGYVCWAW